MLIDRILTEKVRKMCKPGRVVVLYGPRQVGKTTLIKSIMNELPQPLLSVVGDDIRYRDVLSSQSKDVLSSLVGKYQTLVIDEAQRIPNIGVNLKILVDEFPQLTVLVTGSSSLDLASKINEPLTGRKKVVTLHPVSYQEMTGVWSPGEIVMRLDDYLLFGSYPRVLTLATRAEKESYLGELVGSYLYKDILELEGVKKSEKIVSLLRLLAYQIGNNVSIAELAMKVGMDVRTVNKYLDLLEQSFVIYYRGGFARSMREEIAKTGRYYFTDNGVRNALINNFNQLEMRDDVGKLWENYLTIERKKYLEYQEKNVNSYFWRTYGGQEIDLVEEGGGEIVGLEMKWGSKKVKVPTSWRKAYPKAGYQVINRDNWSEWLVRGE